MNRIAIALLFVSALTAADLKVSAGTIKRTATGQDFVSAPVAGYLVRHEPPEVRAILGIPGATHFSEPLVLPDGAGAVRMTPGQRWLLVLREGGVASAWIPESGLERALPDVQGLDQMAAFGHFGKSAVFYSRTEARAAIYTGLPDDPKLTFAFQTEQWPSELVSLAISEDGGLVAGATASGEIYLLTSHGEPTLRLLTDGAAAGSLSFWGSGQRLVFLDAAGSRLLTVDNPMQGTGVRQLSQIEPPLTPGQARLAILPGDSLLAIDAPAGRLVQFDAYSPGELTGHVRLTEMEPLSQSAVVAGRGALWLLREDGSPGRIVAPGAESLGVHYVPAAPALPVRSSAHEGPEQRRGR
jgi:hypothetical protein